MRKDVIYLDHSATTPIREEVRAYVYHLMGSQFGNPSSLYDLGLTAEKIIKESRRVVAKTLHGKEKEIVFTSCGSESNNMAIRGVCRVYQKRGKHLIVSAIEHPSVMKVMEDMVNLGFELTVLPVDREGRIRMGDFAAALRPDTILVSIMLVNNELGTVMPIADAAAIIREKAPQALFHVDGVQAFAHMNVDVKKLDIDLFSLSGHKFGAPKGVGALYIREGVRVHPLILGGGQEDNRRSGTENIYYIGALAKAAELSLRDREGKNLNLRRVRQALPAALEAEGVEFIINSPSDGAPNIINISFPALRGRSEVLLHGLEQEGIYCSAGSACHAKGKKTSETLAALGMDPILQNSTLRFSFGDEQKASDMIRVAAAVKNKIAEIGLALGGK